VATRSTVPDEVETGDKLIESREPMIISLILDVLTCISLLAVQVSTEVKYDGILLAEPVNGISSDSVVSSTGLCSSHPQTSFFHRRVHSFSIPSLAAIFRRGPLILGQKSQFLAISRFENDECGVSSVINKFRPSRVRL